VYLAESLYGQDGIFDDTNGVAIVMTGYDQGDGGVQLCRRDDRLHGEFGQIHRHGRDD
jgi:hypothetical protein